MGSLRDRRKDAEQKGLLSSGEYLKIQEGDNRWRLMTEPIPHPGMYEGRANFKWLCYVIDRRDGQVKPYFMPSVVFRQLENFQSDEEYAFEDFPMPYDVNLKAIKAGTKDVTYSLIASRKSTPITALEHLELAKKVPLDELQATLQAKDREKAESSQLTRASDDGSQLTANDIPF